MPELDTLRKCRRRFVASTASSSLSSRRRFAGRASVRNAIARALAAAGESVAVKVFDESSDVHVGTTCGTCKMSPIVGVRYTRPAPGGADLDLCEPCLLEYRTGPARGERRLPFKRVPHPVREVAL